MMSGDRFVEFDGAYVDFADFAIAFQDEAGHKLPSVSVHVDGKIKRTRSYGAEPFTFLRRHTQRTPKVTMPAPPIFHFFGGRLSVDPVIRPPKSPARSST